MINLTNRFRRLSSRLDGLAERTAPQAEYQRTRDKTLLWMAMNGIR